LVKGCGVGQFPRGVVCIERSVAYLSNLRFSIGPAYFKLRIFLFFASIILFPVMNAAHAACSAPSGASPNVTVTCTDNVPSPITFGGQVNVLNVNGLSNNVTGISLIRSGSQPLGPSSGLYVCSPGGTCNISNTVSVPTCINNPALHATCSFSNSTVTT